MYQMKDIAKKYNITQSTIRYYDREGLLPFTERTQGGIRYFTDSDIEWLDFIISLKDSGMSVKNIKSYIDAMYENNDLEKCLDIFIEHKKYLENQMKNIQRALDYVNHTIWDISRDKK